MSLICDWKKIATNIYIPDDEYYMLLGEYYTDSTIDNKRSMLEAWERE